MKLPINQSPRLTSRDPEAYVFAMLTSEGNEHLPFLLSRYISVAAYDDISKFGSVIGYNNNYVDYYFWRCERLMLDTVQLPNYAVEGNTAVEIAKSLLNSGEYVIGIWNEQCVPGKPSYQRRCIAADFLLFGYDEAERVFYSLGWYNGEFKEFTVSYSVFEKALYLSTPPMHLLWGVRISDRDMGFDTANVICELREFVNADGKNNDSCAFGYKAIEYLAKDVKTRQKANGSFDYRELLFLAEYTGLMTARVDYLLKNKMITQAGLLSEEKMLEKTAMDTISCRESLGFDAVAAAIIDIAERQRSYAERLLTVLEENYETAV